MLICNKQELRKTEGEEYFEAKVLINESDIYELMSNLGVKKLDVEEFLSHFFYFHTHQIKHLRGFEKLIGYFKDQEVELGVDDELICGECSEEIDEDDSFCRSCGNDMS